MGATNKTDLLDLPLYIDDDRPTWRGDVNGTNSAIDAAYGALQATLNDVSLTLTKKVDKDSQVISLLDHVSNDLSSDLTTPIQTFISTLPNGSHLLVLGSWRVDGTLTFPQNNISVELAEGATIDRSNMPITVAWTASKSYASGALVRVGTAALQCTVSGVSGAIAPTPPTTVNSTVNDGGVTWKRVISPEAKSCLIFTGDSATLCGGGVIKSPSLWEGINSPWTDATVKFTGSSGTVRDISLVNVVKYGIGFFDTNGTSTVDHVSVIGNYPSAQWNELETGHQGIRFDPGATASRIRVVNSNVDSCVQGWCGGNFGIGSSSGSIIANNVFTNCWNHGTYNSGGLTDMMIANNVFRDCSRPIVMIDNGHVVIGNTLTASGTGGTLYWTASISMRNAINCIVANNNIQGDVFAGSGAIYFNHVSGGTELSGNICSGNRVKVSTINQGYCIIFGTTNSVKMCNNIVKDNIVEGPGVPAFGVINLTASPTADDATGNVVSGNVMSILGQSSGIYFNNLSHAQCSNNIISLAADLSSAATISGIALIGATQYAVVAGNIINVPAKFGANTTFRGISEAGGAVTSSKIIDNQITLSTAKLVSATPYILGGGGAFLRAAADGAPTSICGPGSQWTRTDGGAGTTLYIKESAENSADWRAV